MCRNQHVAIKKFNSDSQLDVFKQELSIMCLVQHPNLVQCYGGVTVNGWIIVEELMQVNLSTVLANPNIQMDLGIMINIALGISKGLSFLHLHCQLIHRDLKSYNVLINTYEGLQVKITDFGISKIVSQSQMTANVGTIAWIAPEVFGQKGYNQKADIYSLAIVMWELTTREIPFSNLASFAIPLCVIRGERPPLPKDINPTWKKLITDCWQKNPKRRPNITSVLSSLKKLHESLPPSTKSLNKLNVLEVLQTETRNELVTKQLSQKSSPVDLNFRVSTPPTSMLIQQANSEEDDDKEEQSTEIVTCSVPTIWASPVLNLETKINQYFSNLNSSSRKGTIEIFSKRFLLLPHSTLSGLLKSVQTHFQFNVNDDAIYFASHIQYTMGQLFATNVALSFFSIQPSTDPLSRVISCCIYSAFLGIGFVEISDLSTFKNGNFDVLITHFTFILAEGEHQAKTDPKFFVCGWLSGWCNIASSSPRETFHVHTKKISTTKVIYTFLTAHPQQIAKEIKEFRKTDAIETSKEKISAIILNQRLQDARLNIPRLSTLIHTHPLRSGVLEDSLGSGDVTNSSPRGTTPTKKDWFSHSLLEITRINNPFTSKDFHSIKSFSGKVKLSTPLLPPSYLTT
jgi:serine/threonine protein kinase